MRLAQADHSEPRSGGYPVAARAYAMRLDLDCPVACADSAFGELTDVIVDPSAHRLTHLVVQPHQRHELARLVAIVQAHVDEGSGSVSLNCTVAELNEAPPLQESRYLPLGERPDTDAASDVGIEVAFETASPYSLGIDALGAGLGPVDYDPHVTVIYDRVPKGMVELRRASEVTSSDGHHVGHVIGLVVDDQAQITQLVLEHGHLWGKRELAIPNGWIDRIRTDEVVLRLSNDEFKRAA